MKRSYDDQNGIRRKSHPAGVRGLKPDRNTRQGSRSGVAPRRGAWVETSSLGKDTTSASVAPRRGAWVETSISITSSGFRPVAPRRGAWVETLM